MTGEPDDYRTAKQDDRIGPNGPRKSEDEYVHGTIWGYQRHVSLKEVACEPCLNAARKQGAKQRRKKKKIPQNPQICHNPRCGHLAVKHPYNKLPCKVRGCPCTMYWGPLVPKGPVKVRTES